MRAAIEVKKNGSYARWRKGTEPLDGRVAAFTLRGRAWGERKGQDVVLLRC